MTWPDTFASWCNGWARMERVPDSAGTWDNVYQPAGWLPPLGMLVRVYQRDGDRRGWHEFACLSLVPAVMLVPTPQPLSLFGATP